MENAADALKMAFGVLVFIVALSVLFFQLSHVKETADTVLWYSDKTSYYEWETGSTENGRVVGEETIISALHKQVSELTYIIIEEGTTTEMFTPSSSNDKRTQYIEEKLKTGDKIYLENITEITTGGKYKVGEDGTRITIIPGTTRTYITYTKKN